MDLWIRSQDGTMISKFDSIITAGPVIYVYIGNYHFLLGNYKTEERALEVLDEIQSFIENNYESYMPSHSNGIIANGNIVLKTRRVVYEIPKK